ncbi:helix-turn-helix transcriptional regulator [Ornithinimicrobium ciconiae]|uniref:Helix-turn-helix transcriptional regulator n=1 Tax=Ornithinimicrobium ciconiae TaxID=2594265 RepID=A0A516GDK7_9MICO|nr:helix-turn-helix transcriptional regulator [Ornithinimicrobium ciconiae]
MTNQDVRNLTLTAQVALAVRAARRRDGHSQRDLAHLLGWSQSRVRRLETDASSVPLSVVAEAVALGGFELAVVDPFVTHETPAWEQTDLVARDRAGRRFPAHLEVVPCPGGPAWWWDQEYIRLRRPLGATPTWTTVARDPLRGLRLPGT